MRIMITGSTGLVGNYVANYFQQRGHNVTRLVRPTTKVQTQDSIVEWNIEAQEINHKKLEGHDIVIHLAGANIANKRWTPGYKRVIHNSRVESTLFLCHTLSHLKKRPWMVFSASAVGFYGSHTPQEEIDESSAAGKDFLAKVCQHWEKATESLQKLGIQVIHMRLGAVLSKEGGALAKMLPIFRRGLGGKLGSGRQPFSWIALKEIPEIIAYLMEKKDVIGPINFVSPQIVSNEEFTKILALVLDKKEFLPVPSFAVKLLLGEMADALLLEGAHVVPRRLQEIGYSFRYPDLEEYLKEELF